MKYGIAKNIKIMLDNCENCELASSEKLGSSLEEVMCQCLKLEDVKMNFVYGDLIKLAQEGMFDVIIHGCNCFIKMGRGIAKTISEKYPEVLIEDGKTVYGDKRKLGCIAPIKVSDGFIVINAYTQYNYGRGFYVKYEAIRECFKKIKIQFHGKRIGYPLIGCGLAGGNWKIVSEIINKELDGENHKLVEWSNK